MSTKECKFCDQCGTQITVYDTDGDPVHHGLEIKGEITVDYTRRTHCGSSHGRVLTIGKADLCSTKCLAVRLDELIKYSKEN